MMKPTKRFRNGSTTVVAPKPEIPQASPVSAPAAVTATPVAPSGPAPGRVSFELVRPDARKVFVAGSFNGWAPEKNPLRSDGDGRWAGELILSPGRHEYLFVVDGSWLADPKARESVANPFGGRNSVVFAS